MLCMQDIAVLGTSLSIVLQKSRNDQLEREGISKTVVLFIIYRLPGML